MSDDIVRQLATDLGGTIEEMQHLPDGSGFAVMSLPLPEKHWIYERAEDGYSIPPPMPFRMGNTPELHHVTLTRADFADKIREAGKYAVRASTMGGREMDFDPDAMLQNLVVGMLGYWTNTGLSGDEAATEIK